jgi:hypothetical protein
VLEVLEDVGQHFVAGGQETGVVEDGFDGTFAQQFVLFGVEDQVELLQQGLQDFLGFGQALRFGSKWGERYSTFYFHQGHTRRYTSGESRLRAKVSTRTSVCRKVLTLPPSKAHSARN